MRNVVKGFQFSQMAVPKMHMDNINAGFSNYHGPIAPKAPKAPTMSRRPLPRDADPIARRPGKNVGIRGGYKV